MKNLYRIKSVRCYNWFIEASCASEAVAEFERKHAGDPVVECVRTNPVTASEVF